MKIVIDIPEDDYDFIKDLNAVMGGRVSCKTIQYNVINAIKNGTPLPKGHGRLIDADYKVSSDGRTIDTVCGYIAPTIIEADKGEEE